MSKCGKTDTARRAELSVMPNGNVVALNGGRRSRRTANFLADLHDVWEEFGEQVLHWVAKNDPGRLLDAMITLAKVNKIEVKNVNGFEGAKTKAEVLEQVERRAGPAGRRLFEAFVRKFEELERSGEETTVGLK